MKIKKIIVLFDDNRQVSFSCSILRKIHPLARGEPSMGVKSILDVKEHPRSSMKERMGGIRSLLPERNTLGSIQSDVGVVFEPIEIGSVAGTLKRSNIIF